MIRYAFKMPILFRLRRELGVTSSDAHTYAQDVCFSFLLFLFYFIITITFCNYLGKAVWDVWIASTVILESSYIAVIIIMVLGRK